jgi:hypothetical protein
LNDCRKKTKRKRKKNIAHSTSLSDAKDPKLDNLHNDPMPTRLYRAVPASRAGPLQCVDHASDPVFEEIGDVAEGIAVWEKVPSTGAVAVVVEPRTEDEVCGDAEEDTSKKT